MLLLPILLFFAFSIAKARNTYFAFSSEQVLAFLSEKTDEIDLSAIPVKVCGEQRACFYAHGPPCAAKGQYLAGVREKGEKIIHSCCQTTPPVQDHQSDQCQTHFAKSIENFMRSTPHSLYRPTGAPHGGKSTPPPIMQWKASPPGNPQMLIKSISKLNQSGVQGYSVSVCTPQCGRSTTTQPTTQKGRTQQQPVEPRGAGAGAGAGGAHGNSGSPRETGGGTHGSGEKNQKGSGETHVQNGGSQQTGGGTHGSSEKQKGSSGESRHGSSQESKAAAHGSSEKTEITSEKLEGGDTSERRSEHHRKKAHHKKKHLLGEGQHCFSGDMTVMTLFGIKRMDQIHVGDQVLVTSFNAEPVYEPIEWLYHRDISVVADFIKITTRSGRTLVLSRNHLIPVFPCSNATLNTSDLDTYTYSSSLFARRIKVGNCIASQIDNQSIKFISDQVIEVVLEKKRGIYSPITKAGTIVVNDVYVSCYSSVENQVAQKSIHSILINIRRSISAIWHWITGCTMPGEDSDIPLSLKVVLKLAQLAIPDGVFSA